MVGATQMSDSITQRIMRGREAEQRLKDEHLNEIFDNLIERWLGAIVSAKPNQQEEIIEAKRRIDAIAEVRRALKIQLDDGFIALTEQEREDV